MNLNIMKKTMINANDVISFIETLINKNIDFSTCNTPKVCRIWTELGCRFVSIVLNIENNYITLEFSYTNTIYINNISKVDILDLQKVFIKAEEYSNERTEYKFKHYFDKINEVDKTIDNLDDDED